ncbi:MAG: class I SAM-dependent methyltransferase [Terracidiphilus sp.]
MAFYRDRVYPQIVSALGNPKPIDDIRRRMIPLAHGEVLELGVGPGVNFPYYDPGTVSKVFALEPNPGMLKRAREQRRLIEIDVEFVDLPGERIPLDDQSVDTVVSTFTMCTIPGLVEALRGVGRVLRPGGQLIFFEHGLAPDPPVQRRQKRVEPFFKLAFEGCHVTRHIPSTITESGFKIEKLDEGYLAPFPKSGTYCFWGVARPESK